MKVNNFTVVESVYGKFVVARHCDFQAEALIKTGRTHIETELENIFVIVDLLPDQAIIVDGGANIGFFAIPVAQRVQDRGSRVIAFEPQRELFYALAGTIVLNDLSNCWVHNLGLGDRASQAQMPPVNYGAQGDYGTVNLELVDTKIPKCYYSTNTVDIVTIDSMNLPRLDFLKLDVEGYELEALAGARNTLTQHRPCVWVEYFKNDDFEGQFKIKSALSYLDNYAFLIMDYQNMMCVPREFVEQHNLVTNNLEEI
jgi:FkbM family methyltransferase